MMHYALSDCKRDLHHTPDYPWRMQSAADRLRFARERAGYDTAKAAAEAMGVSVSTYIQHENGSRGFPAGRAERYAAFFKTTPEWLLYARGQPPEKSKPTPAGLRPITRLVPVIGVVQAGLWQEVVDDEPEPEELLPINLQGFEGSQLFALRVSGNSMNLFYPDGSRVVVCPAQDIGIREGDHVVVRRRRGGLVETTLKEVLQEKDGVALWPRSTDPRYQEPIRLKTVRDADEGPEIIAVVVATYTVRPMQSRPLIQL